VTSQLKLLPNAQISLEGQNILSPVTLNTKYTSLVSQVMYKANAQELLQDKRLEMISAVNVTVLFLIVLY